MVARIAFIAWCLSAEGMAQTASSKAVSSFAADCAEKKFMDAVLVNHHGMTVFAAACGFANAEWEIPNTVGTKFRAASIAKQFTAAAVLLLQQDGKLSVEKPIGAFIDGLPPEWQAATIHQLPTHTSGVPNNTGPSTPQLDRLSATPRESLEAVKDKPLQFAHGTKLAYNNTGYILLGILIEKVSAMSYPQFVHRRVFAPALMNDSGSTRRAGFFGAERTGTT